tara:strand:- start:1858 stop:2784 length:927 start_codon:yes stop_codon:yes gene_type:complete
MNKVFYIFVLLILFNCKNLYSSNVYIELKIENEIITNFDIEKEKKYLLALNNNLSQVPEKKLYELSKNSIINEKIKKKELLIYFDLEKAEMIMKDVIKNFYIKVGFENETQFSNYLKQYEISIDYVKEKLKIETLWNQLIYNKFNNQISVDNNKLKIKMNNELKNKSKIKEFNLSEILFDLKQGEKYKKKYKLILESINKSGFENTSNLYSISDSSKFGGKIGWLKKTQLSKNIIEKLDKIKSGEITEPIQTSNGYLILKINTIREIKKKIDLDEELKNLIEIEKNRQLNEFSQTYFNKVKKNIILSD